jgi:hypothetical protein
MQSVLTLLEMGVTWFETALAVFNLRHEFPTKNSNIQGIVVRDKLINLGLIFS